MPDIIELASQDLNPCPSNFTEPRLSADTGFKTGLLIGFEIMNIAHWNVAASP